MQATARHHTSALIVVAVALAAAALVWMASGPTGDEEARAFGGTPTPTPTPTPPGGGTFPATLGTFTNSTGQPANRLDVEVDLGWGDVPVEENAPGCPAPGVYPNGSFSYTHVVVIWPTACVDPGETVELLFYSDCPHCGAPGILSYSFSLQPTPTPTPTPVGGIAEFAAGAESDRSSAEELESGSRGYLALAGLAAATAALGGGWWLLARWRAR